MNGSAVFSLVAGGAPVEISNDALVTSGPLSVTYTLPIAGTATVSVEGVSSLAGVVAVLDTATINSTTTRSIGLNSVTYDAFIFRAIWSGQNQNFRVNVAVSEPNGAGPTFDAALQLTNVHTAS